MVKEKWCKELEWITSLQGCLETPWSIYWLWVYPVQAMKGRGHGCIASYSWWRSGQTECIYMTPGQSCCGVITTHTHTHATPKNLLFKNRISWSQEPKYSRPWTLVRIEYTAVNSVHFLSSFPKYKGTQKLTCGALRLPWQPLICLRVLLPLCAWRWAWLVEMYFCELAGTGAFYDYRSQWNQMIIKFRQTWSIIFKISNNLPPLVYAARLCMSSFVSLLFYIEILPRSKS